MRAVARPGSLDRDRDSDPLSRLAIGKHIIPPTLAIEVGREKSTGIVGADGIHAERLFTPQVGFYGALIEPEGNSGEDTPSISPSAFWQIPLSRFAKLSLLHAGE